MNKCKNCGHSAFMHSDSTENTHTGECFVIIKNKEFCKCKQFIKGEENEI